MPPRVPEFISLTIVHCLMGFHCPWGCAEDVEHENAWECPKYAQKFLGAVQAVAQKLEKAEP